MDRKISQAAFASAGKSNIPAVQLDEEGVSGCSWLILIGIMGFLLLVGIPLCRKESEHVIATTPASPSPAKKIPSPATVAGSLGTTIPAAVTLPQVATPKPTLFPVAPLTEAEARREALELFPELGEENSDFNKAFLAEYNFKKKYNSRFFDVTDWPLRLAKEVAQQESKKKK